MYVYAGLKKMFSSWKASKIPLFYMFLCIKIPVFFQILKKFPSDTKFIQISLPYSMDAYVPKTEFVRVS